MPRGARSNAEALGRGRKATTLAASLGRKLASLPSVQALDAARVGSAELRVDSFADDPVGFVRQVLGVEKLTRQQIRVLLSFVTPDPDDGKIKPRVCVRSGNKRGKTESVAMLALWFYCSFPRARVLFTAPTDRQVNGALWRAIRWLVKRAVVPIPGAEDIGQLARTGLKNEATFAEIVGFTAKDMESVAGISGSRMLYIVDEASGVADQIWEAIDGNRAGGGWLIAISNPTRTQGKFFEAFTTEAKAPLFHRIHLRHDEPPDVTIPGLATPAWIEEMIAEHGAKSPFVIVRVYGDFFYEQDGQIIDFAALTAAQEAWPDVDADPNDPLYIGVDPAGPGLGGDESAFAVRRGAKILAVRAQRGLDEAAVVATALALADEFRSRSRETPIIVLDRTGPVGAKVLGMFRARLEQSGGFNLLPISASDKAARRPDLYDRMRDELLANMAQWLRTGGTLPPNETKLIKDLHAPKWYQTLQGRLKATDKREVIKLLGRSPDRGDAACLAVWQLGALDRARENDYSSTEAPDLFDLHSGGIDPYAALDWTRNA